MYRVLISINGYRFEQIVQSKTLKDQLVDRLSSQGHGFVVLRA